MLLSMTLLLASLSSSSSDDDWQQIVKNHTRTNARIALRIYENHYLALLFFILIIIVITLIVVWSPSQIIKTLYIHERLFREKGPVSHRQFKFHSIVGWRKNVIIYIGMFQRDNLFPMFSLTVEKMPAVQ